MAKQKGEIKKAEENRGAVPGNRFNRAVRKEEEGSDTKGGGGKDPEGETVLQVKKGDESGSDRRREVMLKAARWREGHAIKFIEGDKDGDGYGGAEDRWRGAPDQEKEEGEKDNPGNNPLLNGKSP